MRKITGGQILTFTVLSSTATALGCLTDYLLLGKIPLGDFRGVVLTLGGFLFVQGFAIVVHRLYMRFNPLLEGEVPEGSQQEFIYHVYVLFYLIFFYPVMRSGFWPAPFMRLYYLALGAKLGANTFSQGYIFDPLFVQIGNNSVVGQNAMLVPHAIEGAKLVHESIIIGDDVTIGGLATILPGVRIDNGAVVAIGAVVPKGTHIGPGEVWGGIPAKRIR